MDKETADFIAQLQDVSSHHRTELDCLRYDFTEQKKYSDEMVARFASFGRLNFKTLEAMQKFADKTATQHEAFVVDTCKALEALQAIVNSQHRELHLLRDTVASLQQDVATLEKMVGDHINGSTFDGDMKVRLQNLEDKFKLMEESTGIEYNPWYCDDETDEGGAERAEMEYQRIQEEYGTEV